MTKAQNKGNVSEETFIKKYSTQIFGFVLTVILFTWFQLPYRYPIFDLLVSSFILGMWIMILIGAQK